MCYRMSINFCCRTIWIDGSPQSQERCEAGSASATSLDFAFLFMKSLYPQRPRDSHLTQQDNSLPYGCGSLGYNICGLIRSNPAGNDRTALPRACYCAWLDGAFRPLAADDFKAYCLPGPRSDCDQAATWTRECVHAQAGGAQDSL